MLYCYLLFFFYFYFSKNTINHKKAKNIALEVSGTTKDTIYLDTLVMDGINTFEHIKNLSFKNGDTIIFKFIILNIMEDTLNIRATSGDGGLYLEYYKKRRLLPKESTEIVYVFYTKNRGGGFSKEMSISGATDENSNKSISKMRVIFGKIE